MPRRTPQPGRTAPARVVNGPKERHELKMERRGVQLIGSLKDANLTMLHRTA